MNNDRRNGIRAAFMVGFWMLILASGALIGAVK